MRRGGRGSGGRGGGGLYGNFVSANDDVMNKPYRGAEIPPPPNLQHSGRGPIVPMAQKAQVGLTSAAIALNKKGYSTMSSIDESSLNYSQYGVAIKRARTEDEYFNSDDEDEKKKALEDLPAYQPAPGSPGADDKDSDSEEDPLDAYMASLENDAKTKGMAPSKPVEKKTPLATKSFTSGSTGALKTGMIIKPKVNLVKGVRDDIDNEDDEESYYRWLEENPTAGTNKEDSGDEIDLEYDADGNPIAPLVSKYIDPLPPIDHSSIQYLPYTKNFYEEHPDIVGLSKIQVIDLQQKLNVHVSGPSPPKPVSSFAHFGFDDALLKAIRKSEFSTPTPIQAQGIPAILGGRDVIGIAKTGSGKTAAFLWPMLVHIMDQPHLKKGEGPLGLVLVPTRELALQIYSEAKKYGKVYNLNIVCAYGGGSKWEQSKAFEQGAEIAIATPGRMIDMIKLKVTNLERVTYMILDEADRMFDLGFETQVRSICDHVRPDRQCSLFSATFKKKVEKLARDVLTDPIKIVQGDVGVASEDVTQIVKVLPLGGYKWNWVIGHLVQFMSEGSVLIFVTKKQNCEEFGHNLKLKEFNCRVMHGDILQHERNEIIQGFKKQEFPILVATDVAARGLDIPHIRNVINFDVARDIDTHTHRVGRTGRAGVKGKAHTLVTENDKEFCGHIVRNLEAANQIVQTDLMNLAMQSSWFKNSRFKKGRGKGAGGAGLGYRERPQIAFNPQGGEQTSLAEQFAYDRKNKKEDSNGASNTGPGTDRLSAVKKAFKSQFTSNFKAAETDEGGYNPNARLIEEKKERKRPSRWE